MGFNKRYVNSEFTIRALKDDRLGQYYGKSDAIIFEDDLSLEIFTLFKEGKSEKEILTIINKNMEEKTNEVYQSN